jgi:6-phosphogluconolactonase
MQTSVKFWSVIIIGMALCAVPLRAEFIYMANEDGNSVSAYKIEENGALTQVRGSPFPSGKWPFSLVVDLHARLVFTANMGDDTISIYRIEADGSLEHLADSPAGPMPAALAIDPFGRFLYVTNLDGTKGDPQGDPGAFDNITSYRIASNGALTAVSTVMTGYSPLSIAPDPKGQFIYVGNVPLPEHIETISGYRVNGNGSLTQLPGSPFPDGEGPIAMAIDPLGRFLYAAGEWDLALNTYGIARTGALTELPTTIGDGLYPSNTVAVGPLGRFVYQLSFLLPNSPVYDTFSVYRVSANGLTLVSKLPADYSDAIAVDFNERFLFSGATEYRIGSNGSLTALPSPALGFSPTAMAVSPW